MKKRMISVFMGIVMLSTSYLLPVSASENEELKGGLKRGNGGEIVVSDIDIFVGDDGKADDKADDEAVGSAEYTGSWDVYSTNYYYNQLTAEQKSDWDKLDADCYRILTGNDNLQKNSGNYSVVKTDNYTYSKNDAYNLAYLFYISNPQYYFLNFDIEPAAQSKKYAPAIKIYSAYINGSDRAAATSKLKNKLDNWTGRVQGSTDADKLGSLFDIICADITYKDPKGEESGQSIMSAVNGQTICAGYALAVEAVANYYGIELIDVISKEHAWNRVRLNGCWYEYDATNGDGDGQANDYSYYLAPTSSLTYDRQGKQMYTVDSSFQNMVSFPVCETNAGSTQSKKGKPVVPENTVDTPVAEVSGTKLKLSNISQGATVYYTLDDREPSLCKTKSFIYNGEVDLSSGQTFKCVAIKPGYMDSDLCESQTGDIKPIATPTINQEKTPTATPTTKPGKTPTATPTTKPGKTPTATPTTKPGKTPTATPTVKPGKTPTATPTTKPGKTPTATPTTKPGKTPTENPWKNPTKTPADNSYSDRTVNTDDVNARQEGYASSRDTIKVASDKTMGKICFLPPESGKASVLKGIKGQIPLNAQIEGVTGNAKVNKKGVVSFKKPGKATVIFNLNGEKITQEYDIMDVRLQKKAVAENGTGTLNLEGNIVNGSWSILKQPKNGTAVLNVAPDGLSATISYDGNGSVKVGCSISGKVLKGTVKFKAEKYDTEKYNTEKFDDWY